MANPFIAACVLVRHTRNRAGRPRTFCLFPFVLSSCPRRPTCSPICWPFLCRNSLGKSQGALDAEGGAREKRGECGGYWRTPGRLKAGLGTNTCACVWGGSVGRDGELARGWGGSPSGPCVQCFSGDSSAQPTRSGGESREGQSLETPNPAASLRPLLTTETQDPRPPRGTGRDAGASRSDSVTAGNTPGTRGCRPPLRPPRRPQTPRHPPGRGVRTGTPRPVPSRLPRNTHKNAAYLQRNTRPQHPQHSPGPTPPALHPSPLLARHPLSVSFYPHTAIRLSSHLGICTLVGTQRATLTPTQAEAPRGQRSAQTRAERPVPPPRGPRHHFQPSQQL